MQSFRTCYVRTISGTHGVSESLRSHGTRILNDMNQRFAITYLRRIVWRREDTFC